MKEKPTSQKSRDQKLERVIYEEDGTFDDKLELSPKLKDNSVDMSSEPSFMNLDGPGSTPGVSVKEFAIKEEPNAHYRAYMEDYATVRDDILGDKKSGLFIILDGHGGDLVARVCVDFIPEEFIRLYPTYKNNIPELMVKLFENTEKRVIELEEGAEETGSTGLVVFITEEEGKQVLYSANVGDTRCVWLPKNGPQRLSYDHKAIDTKEQERIRSVGGLIMHDRVSGVLAITRAFGDLPLKNEGVSVVPFVQRLELNEHGVLVMATDGLWDVLNDEDVHYFIYSQNLCKSHDIAEKLVELALQRNTRDNTTAIAAII